MYSGNVWEWGWSYIYLNLKICDSMYPCFTDTHGNQVPNTHGTCTLSTHKKKHQQIASSLFRPQAHDFAATDAANATDATDADV